MSFTSNARLKQGFNKNREEVEAGGEVLVVTESDLCDNARVQFQIIELKSYFAT